MGGSGAPGFVPSIESWRTRSAGSAAAAKVLAVSLTRDLLDKLVSNMRSKDSDLTRMVVVVALEGTAEVMGQAGEGGRGGIPDRPRLTTDSPALPPLCIAMPLSLLWAATLVARAALGAGVALPSADAARSGWD